MSLFKIGKKTSVKVPRHQAYPMSSGVRVVGDYGGGCDVNMGSNPSMRQDFYNPVRDRLDLGSIIEDWIPHSSPAINRMFRNLYFRDGIAGPAVDIWSLLPFSSWEFIGIDDPAVLKFYNDALQQIFEPPTLESISKEMLVIGRNCSSLNFNESKGYWDSVIPHDPDFLEITPVPYEWHDPLIDLRPSPGIMNFINSPDPRAKMLLSMVPHSIIDNIRRRGLVPLEPWNTLWVARQVSPYDKVGTSLYTRILPFWAIEKPLLNATAAAARRRAGTITHVTIPGDPDRGGIPSTEELQAVADLFMQTENDPVNPLVVTREGITAQEISASQPIWKMSDEWPFLSEGKMRALGINDAFLSGDASYNSYDEARSVFMEQIRSYREIFTRKTILKLAERLARIHGIVKRSTAELTNNIRVSRPVHKEYETMPELHFNKNINMKQALSFSKTDLKIPEVHWSKSLQPEGDHRILEILETLKENGVPIPLRIWANLGGISIDNILDSLEEDIKLKTRIEKYKTRLSDVISAGGEDEGESGGEEDFSFASTPEKGLEYLTRNTKELGAMKRRIKNVKGKIKAATNGEEKAQIVKNNMDIFNDFIADEMDIVLPEKCKDEKDVKEYVSSYVSTVEKKPIAGI